MPSRPVGDLSIDSLHSRFCYWQGDGGERYLFSQISIDDIANFSDCVLLLASEQRTIPQIQWIGNIADLSPMTLNDVSPDMLVHLSAYVHLLAGSEVERESVMADLGKTPDRAEFKISA